MSLITYKHQVWKVVDISYRTEYATINNGNEKMKLPTKAGLFYIIEEIVTKERVELDELQFSSYAEDMTPADIVRWRNDKG